MDTVKINKTPLEINDILKMIYLDEQQINDYSKCKIIDETKEVNINIIDVDDFKFFIVNFKDHDFTLTEFMIFNPKFNELKFNLFVLKSIIDENLKIDEIPEIEGDKLLNYN